MAAVVAQEQEKATAGEVISIMDALRQSVEAADAKKPPAKSVARRTKKKKAG